MRRTAILAAAGFLFLVPAAAHRAAFADDADLARALVGSESAAKSASEAQLAELVAAVAKDPQSPYATAALRAILRLAPECRGADAVEKALDAVLLRGVADGETDELLREVLSARAWARGDDRAARDYDADRGYLHRFAAVGPIAWPDAVLVHRALGPESGFDPAQTWEGSRRRVGWTPLPEDPDSGWIDPSERLRDVNAGIWYATARVRSKGARDVAIKVYCRDSFKVFLNGAEVLVTDRERDHTAWTQLTTAALGDGWNRILVKVAGRSSFAVKLCDPATGLPLADVEEGDPMDASAHAAPSQPSGPRAWRTTTERVIDECLSGSVSDPARLCLAADLADDDWRLWDAWKLHEKAVASLGSADAVTAANVHALRGTFLATFWPLPNVQKKLRATKELADALAKYPGHVAAKVRLAQYENEDDHPDRAVKALRESIRTGESYAAWMALARIAKARGWGAEAADAARRAAAVQPLGRDALSFLDDLDEELGNHAAPEKRARARLESDRSDRGAIGTVISALRSQGRHADALKLVRECEARWPLERGWSRRAAEITSALGRTDEALAMWKDLEAKQPSDEGIPRRIGEMLEVRGDKAGAGDAYRRSLAIEPFQPNVWRAITRLEGRDEDFAAGWEPDVQQILASLPSVEELKKQHPKAVAVTVLDHNVTQVRADGSSRSYVHMIYKVLDEKGVEKYDSLPNAGETLLVRAILPDGTVTTPTGMQGAPFNIEGLVPGTVLEQRFAVSERGSAKGYAGDKFYFQDFDLNRNPNPVLLSRMVVLTPDGMKLSPRKRNYDGDPKVESRDGWTATVWEKRDMPIVEPERNMPERDEIFPHVDYSIPASYDDAPWQLFGSRSDSRGSPILDEALAGIVRPGMSDLDKLRAIHEFVNREITGDSASGSGATAVLLEKSGSRDLLFQALARAAGVPSKLGRALPWNGVGRDLSDQDPDDFSGRFTWFEPRGADPVPFFGLAHHAPFGLVPEAYRGSAAFLLDESGGRIVRLPMGGADVDDTATFSIRLDADPRAVHVEGTVAYRNPNGYAYKRTLADNSGDDRRKFAEGQFSSWFANPKLESYELPGLETRGEPLLVRLKGTMSTYLVQQGESWFVSLGLPESNVSGRFVDKPERVWDVVLRGRDDRVDEFTIDLGDAWEVRRLPADHNAVHDVGTYSLTWRLEGRTVRVRRERHFRPARYRPDVYRSFVTWCKSVDDAEDRKLELRKVK